MYNINMSENVQIQIKLPSRCRTVEASKSYYVFNRRFSSLGSIFETPCSLKLTVFQKIEAIYASESFIYLVLNLGTSKQSFPRKE